MDEITFTINVLGMREEYTISNTVHGIKIKSKKKYFDPRSVMISFLSLIIDMDAWKHSWHLNVSEYMFNKKVKAKIADIIDGKIADRESEIEQLKFAKKLLRRKHFDESN